MRNFYYSLWIALFMPIMLFSQTPPFYTFLFNNSLLDQSGTRTFTSGSGISFTTDRNGNANSALSLSGVSTSTNLPLLPYGTAARTISMWVRLDAFHSSGYNPVFGYGNLTNTSGFGGFSGHLSASNLRLYHANNATSNFNHNSAATTLGKWMHLAYTYDGNVFLIYRNGWPVHTSYTTSIFTQNPNSSLFVLGGGITLGGTFTGAIDDLRIYGTALSHSEIISLYNPNTPPANLLYHNTFNGKIEEEYARSSFTELTANIFVTGANSVSNDAIVLTAPGGISSYMPSLPLGNAVRSVAVWMKLTQYDVTFTHWSYGSTNTPPGRQFAMVIFGPSGMLGPANTIRLFFGGGGNHIDFPQTVPLNQWNHFVVTYNGTNISLYRNGTLLGTGTAIINTTTPYFYLLDGHWDDLKVYGVALTATEVSNLYTSFLSNHEIEEVKSMIKVYPNPTSDKFMVQSEETVQSLELINLQGQLMRKALQTNEIQAEGLPRGVYFLRVINQKNEINTEKVLVK